MPIQAVFFDIGGVLLRTEDPRPRQQWQQKLGLQPGELEKLVFENPAAQRSTIGEATESEVWQEVGRSLNLAPLELAELRQDFFAGDRWDEDLLAFIRKLRQRIHTGVISNLLLGYRRKLAKWINESVFDAIIISSEEKCRKPEEKIFRLALGRMGVAPEEAMFFDDFPENVDAANRLGMQAFVFQGSHTAIETLRRIFLNTKPF